MKYTFLINQAGIVDSGLAGETDFNDWAILEYIAEWQIHGSAKMVDRHVWLNYRHLIDEIPMLSVRSKNGLSDRLKKLRELDLISSFQTEGNALYVKVTDFYSSIVRFRGEPRRYENDIDYSIKQGARPNEQGVRPSEQGVRPSEQGVRPSEQGVRPSEQGCSSQRTHILNNHRIDNQNKLPRHNTVELADANIAKADLVSELFSFWIAVMNHGRARLDTKRRRLIKTALGWGYSADDLKNAIRGCANTPHNMGHNERGQRYDGLDVILRSADQIDRFIRNFHHPPQLRNKQQQLEASNKRVLSDWVPPELRHASE